ncbi:type IV pilin protein [Bdellovibrio bacteriovorus]|uniref:Fimbrial protein pilA n=1 Tax=Bdellovibrio bacteriovorus str. Tiberius TaxID=1069642 RepID=K7YTM4_BDEBC|nr:prepilin-type N-terminal cleavage/methylation domain-containing protein [Bdellovibrio bacteriovorus]AFY00968.1 fimbrial protein pilA [Bdellovibrio bacteriovorus str. Tiberius]
MFSVKRKSQSGFSLVELMVVVAIIGILASIAIPSINKYMAKARQSEAKTNLSSIYTAEKAFFTEYNTYDGRFAAVGYTPEGKLRYNVGFAGVGVTAGAGDGYATAPSNLSFDARGYCGTTAGTFQNGCTLLNGASGGLPVALAAAHCTAVAGVTPAGCATAKTTFQAGAVAIIQGTATDAWAIDQAKNLRNTVNGIN